MLQSAVQVLSCPQQRRALQTRQAQIQQTKFVAEFDLEACQQKFETTQYYLPVLQLKHVCNNLSAPHCQAL